MNSHEGIEIRELKMLNPAFADSGSGETGMNGKGSQLKP
jgi:hypothetical protein